MTHSARVALTAVLALALCAVCVLEGRADLDADVKRGETGDSHCSEPGPPP